MIPTKPVDYDLSSHDLPLELRRAWTVHRSEDLHPGHEVARHAFKLEAEEVSNLSAGDQDGNAVPGAPGPVPSPRRSATAWSMVEPAGGVPAARTS